MSRSGIPESRHFDSIEPQICDEINLPYLPLISCVSERRGRSSLVDYARYLLNHIKVHFLALILDTAPPPRYRTT